MSEELMSIDSIEVPGDISKLPTNKELPLGFVELEIKGFNATKTKASDGTLNPKTGKPKVGGKLMYRMQVAITDHPAHSSYKGITEFHNFLIGNDKDPGAKYYATWKTGATDLMKCLKKSKVAMSPTTKISDAMKAAVGNKFVAEVKLDTSKDPQYPDRNRIRNFFAVGEKEPKLVEMLDGPSGASFTPSAFAGQTFSDND